MATKPATAFQVLVRDLGHDAPIHRRFEINAARASEWLRGMPMRDALGAPADDPNAGGGVAELDLYSEGENVHATGTFKGFVTVACSRCVEPVRIDIDDRLQITFMPASKLPRDDDDDAPGTGSRAGGGTHRGGAGHAAAAGEADGGGAAEAAGGAAARGKAAKRGADAGGGTGRKADRAAPADDEDLGAEVGEGDLDVFPYDGERVDLEPLFREELVLSVPYAPLCREDCKGLCAQCGTDLNTGTCSCAPPLDPRLAGLRDIKLPS